MRSLVFVAVVGTCGVSALAYTPGTGTSFTANFNGALDADWEQQNGYLGNPAPWTQVLDGADKVFYADGIGPGGNTQTRHWARHYVQPTPATAFSIAFEHRAELGAGYLFDLEVEQRAPVTRRYRMRIDGNGAVSLWRTVGGAFAQVSATGSGTIPVNQKRWIRFSIEPDGSGHPRVRVRVWGTSAASEPATWNLDVLDGNDSLDRVHRFELTADGPRGIETWIDDLDVWGDGSEGCASSVKTIWLMELSHLDIGFTDPPDVVAAFQKTHLDQVLNNLDADSDYRWTIEAGWDLDRWWEVSTEVERQRMVAALEGGRLKLTAGYASLHTTTAGHEELTRNLYWSSRFAREHGIPLRTWITDDVPGTSFAVPEILKRSGVEFFVGGMNTPFGGRVTQPDHGDRPFFWQGPDGSSVLSWITFDAYAEAFDYGFSFFDTLAVMYKKMGKKLPEQEEAGYPWADLLLMRGFDNHYQGLFARDLVDQWNATYANPKFRLATAEEFFDHMLATHGAAAFPTYAGDFGAAWSGSHANTPHTEAMVRESHRDARAAEALLAAGSAIDGGAIPADSIDYAYRMMLQVDEHSGAGGWPGYFTPQEMNANNLQHLGYAQDAKATADALVEQGLDHALTELSIAGDAVVAVNSLGRPRDGFVRQVLPPDIYAATFRLVERGTGIERPFQRDAATQAITFAASGLPAFGYRVYDLLPGSPTANPTGTLSVTATTLENDFYRIVVDGTDGSVTSLYDKVRGKELIDVASSFDFNELAAATKQQMDLASAPTAVLPGSASTAVLESGPLVASIQVTRTGTPHVKSIYRLRRGEDRFEFDNTLDQAQMPYVNNTTGTRAYTVTLPFDVKNFQIRSETTTRFLNPLADGFPRTSVFDWHNVEHTLAFFDGQKGMLYAVDAADAHSFERLSTLPPPSWATGTALLLTRMKDKSDEYEFEGGSIGAYTIEPGTGSILEFTHHARATAPSFDPVAASRFGFEALNPPLSRFVRRRPGNLPDASASFASVDAPGVLVYTMKNAESGNGIVFRMAELTGAATTARLASGALTFSGPERVEQDEDGGTPLAMDGDGFLVPLQPYETATVRVQAAPNWTPIVLHVDKSAGDVVLSWTGGRAPYTVQRAENAPFTANPATIVDEQPAASAADPVVADGKTYFYLVR